MFSISVFHSGENKKKCSTVQWLPTFRNNIDGDLITQNADRHNFDNIH